MKILHIYNIAGVASTLAKIMDKKYNTKSHVMTTNIADKYNLTTYGTIYNDSLIKFKLRTILYSIKYDIIHCHSTEGIGKMIKKLLPHKKIIIHFHGTDIRNKWKVKEKYFNKVDKVLISTTDLLKNIPKNLDVTWLPTPIDNNDFYNKNQVRKIQALTMSYNADRFAIKKAMEYNLKLVIIKKPMQYENMNNILNNTEYYIDIKRKNGQFIRIISKTALEALSCGCKVIKKNGLIIKKMPKVHEANKVVDQLYKIYKDLIGGK